MLGLQWTAVKPVVHISSRVDMHGKKPPIGGSNEDSELSGVLPVTIKDMDAFAKDSFKNKNYSVSLHFIYTGSPLRRAVMETAAEQFGSRVRLDLQRFPDELQKDVEAASRAAWGENPRWPMNGYDSLAVESLTIHGSDKLEHKQWQDYKGKAPFTIHYPARTLVREKQKDSSYKEQESRFDITRDMQIKQNGKSFEFVTTNNRKVKFFVFMDSLAPADNVTAIAARNRKFHDAAYNEYGWHPVLDKQPQPDIRYARRRPDHHRQRRPEQIETQTERTGEKIIVPPFSGIIERFSKHFTSRIQKHKFDKL